MLARSRYLLFKAPDKWLQSQKVRAKILFEQFPDIKSVYYYALRLGKIFSDYTDKDVARAKLAEGNKLEVKEDGIYINGEKTDSYTFNMDYYWMMGDNRDKSADSRYWGFVPEDHVVGKPIVVWLSLDKDRGWFDGKIRWNRIFKWVDGIK